MRSIASLFLTFALVSTAFSNGENKKAILINGGASDDSNYSIHEVDIQAFNNRLFGGRGIILNAKGPDSVVIPVDVEGNFQRDFWGWVTPRKTSLAGSRPATKSGVFQTFDALMKTPPSQMTVVYGDHGTRSGISLWDEESLSAEDIRSIYSRFPQTQIRSIHLHCYGGAAVVNPDRTLPENMDKLPEFLRRNYLPNKCALTLSSEKELGQYYTWSDDLKENAWNKMFSTSKNPTLRTIKTAVQNDKNFMPSPYLTSDYLIQDVVAVICKTAVKSSTTQIFDPSCNCQKTQPSLSVVFELSDQLKNNLCQKCGSTEVEKLDLQYAYTERVYDDLQAIRQEYQINFLKEKYPKRYTELRSRYEQLERDLQKSITENKRTNAVGTYARLEQVAREYRDKMLLDMLSIDYRADFETYFDTLDEGWVKRNSSKYPIFSRFYFSQPKDRTNFKQMAWNLPAVLQTVVGDYRRGSGLKIPDFVKERSARQIDWLVNATKDEIQSARKIAEARRQQNCFVIAGPVVSGTKNREIRELYDTIKKCEESAIN
ncbi:MAG: hypothetical protein AABZ06_03840 [Bdellovibrionota bacterium]